MKQIMRIFTLILALGLLSAAIPAAAAEDAGVNAAGTAAYEKLTALGIISTEDTFETGKPISRSMFIRLAMEASGDAPAILYGQEQIFADVDASTANADYISAAYTLGYINGDPSGKFYPDADIACSEALKMVAGILGYRIYAEENGGYPAGYMKTANRLSLLNGTSLGAGDAVTYDDAMVILDNTVDADLMEISKIGETVELAAQKGETLLSKRFSIGKMEAVIEANAYTDLMSEESGLEKGEILAGGTRFLVGETAAADALGLYAELYYQDDKSGGTPVLLYLDTDLKDNRILSLRPDEIGGLQGRNLSCYPADGKEKKLMLAAKASLIRNGKMADLTEENLQPEIGSVVLISNDGDGQYDVVKVMDYRPIIVTGVNTDTGTVTGKRPRTDREILAEEKAAAEEKAGQDSGETDGTALSPKYENVSITLDPGDASYDTVILQNGTAVDFGAIGVSQVLSYAESGGSTPLKTVLISGKTVGGTVSVIGQDQTLTVGGTEYDAILAVHRLVKLGTETTFYLDAFGNIVYTGGGIDIVYGYLNGIDIGTFGTVTCRIFTENNRWVTLEMKGKVRYNGQSPAIRAEDLVGRLGGTAGFAYRQLIRYLVDESGKISALDTAQEFTNPDAEKEAIDQNTFRKTSAANKNYRSSSQSFDGDVSVAGNAIIFSVPDQGTSTNEEGFSILPASELAHDTSYNYEAYEGNLVRTASVFVIKNPPKAINSGSGIGSMMLVESIGRAQDSEGSVSDAIFGYWKGIEFSLPVEESALSKNHSPILDIQTLRAGDLIQFSYNDKGNIDYIDCKYSRGQAYQITSLYHANTFMYGEIQHLDATEKRAVIQYSDDGNSAVFAFSSGLQGIYIYEISEERFTAADITDLMEGDQVFGSFRYLQCRELFVIRD